MHISPIYNTAMWLPCYLTSTNGATPAPGLGTDVSVLNKFNCVLQFILQCVLQCVLQWSTLQCSVDVATEHRDVMRRYDTNNKRGTVLFPAQLQLLELGWITTVIQLKLDGVAPLIKDSVWQIFKYIKMNKYFLTKIFIS